MLPILVQITHSLSPARSRSCCACVLYIVETYREAHLGPVIITFEIIFSIIFLLDYVLHLIAAEKKLTYMIRYIPALGTALYDAALLFLDLSAPMPEEALVSHIDADMS